MSDIRPEPELFADGCNGIHIPSMFAQSIKREMVTGVSAEDFDILSAGPDHEHYWEVWDDVLRDAVVTNEGGQRFTLYQDGDLWLIPEGMEWDEDSDFFIWPEDGEPEHDGQPDEAQEWHDFDPDC